MSSPIVNPRERQMSEISTSAAPRDQFRKSYQDYQYAETLQNPFPEVVFSSVANTAQSTGPTSQAGGGDGTNEAAHEPDTRSSLRPDTAGSSKEPALHEDVWVEPPEVPWYKEISRRKWIAIIICTAGITGVLLAILGAMNKFSGGDSTPDASSTNTTTSPTSTTTPTTSSTTSTSPTSTQPAHPPPINCSAPSTFLSSILWVGTDDVGAYSGAFAQASTAAACCELCLSQTPGCAGWLFNGSSAFTPCTRVVLDKEKGKGGKKNKSKKSKKSTRERVGKRFGVGRRGDKDDGGTCPDGVAVTTVFEETDGADGVAGMGPCSGGWKIQ